jgi:alpha-amylase
MPRRLYSLSSAYGTEQQLRDAISALRTHRVGAIADIVINHRVGTNNWADFTHPTWPSNESVCSDDEFPGAKTNHVDTGDHEKSSRDLDHHEETVQRGIGDWMNWLRSDVGFVGWRYDMVKGYAGWAVERYNRKTSPLFSVGEYLDSDANQVVGWIDSSHPEPSYRSAAFDFPFYHALYDAVMNRAFERLKVDDKAPGVLGMWSEKAVTLVKSHDFEEARQGEYGDAIPADGRLVQAYAVTLTHPGTPVVFWRDIYDSPHEDILRKLIGIRRCYRVTSGSKLFIAKADHGDAYAAYITGLQGEIAVKIGPGSWSPEGPQWSPADTKLLASGGDFAVWGDSGHCPAPVR